MDQIDDSQLYASFDPIKVSFTNFMNLQYVGSLYLGSNLEEMKFIYDTGSSWLWIPLSECSGCPQANLYNNTQSLSFEASNTLKELFYGKGYVKGTIAYEKVSPINSLSKAVKMKVLGISWASDLGGTQADGILGLSPVESETDNNFITILKANGIIDHKSFGVFLGNDGDDSSYIDLGVTENPDDTFTSPDWVPLIST
jgi:hypothetical protein